VAARTKKRTRTWRRRLRIAVPVLLLAWAALSHWVVRPRVERALGDVLEGPARVRFAVLWPTLNVTAFGVDVEGDGFALGADRVAVDLDPLAVFGSEAVAGIVVTGLRAELGAGERVDLVRERRPEGGEAAEEGIDLDPVRVPPLSFRDAAVSLREGGAGAVSTRVFSCARLDVDQEAHGAYRLAADAGALARVPFSALFARVLPRGRRVLLSDLRVFAFRGVFGGVLDLDLERAGAFNGDLEWHLVDVAALWRTFGLPYAEKRRGALSGRLVFEGDRPAARALKGAGSLALRRARFFSPLSFRVLGVLEVPVAAESMLHRADVAFSFERGLVYVESASLRAQTYDLEGRGLVGFGGQADLEIAHAGTTVSVSGPLADPRVKVLPLNGITAPFDRLFRERVR